MSLSSYATYAHNVGYDLRDMLREEHYEPYLARLSLASVDEVFDVQVEERELVSRVATAQPAQRLKMLAKLPLDKRFWIIAAAARMAFEASETISAADLHLQPGQPYREMIGGVQAVLMARYHSHDVTWPFPSDPPEGL